MLQGSRPLVRPRDHRHRAITQDTQNYVLLMGWLFLTAEHASQRTDCPVINTLLRSYKACFQAELNH